jgi:uncharacterized protein (TIGR00725 family)
MNVHARLPIVGVIGSGTDPHTERATRIGAWLATLDVHLLTGGGGGVMESVSRAFAGVPGRQGSIIGILPGAPSAGGKAPRAGYPHPYVEIAIRTHLPLSGTRGTEPMSRNHINVLTAKVIIALPGSAGTASELALALAYGRPAIAHIDTPADIEGFPSGIPVEPDFDTVRRFVTEVLSAGMS